MKKSAINKINKRGKNTGIIIAILVLVIILLVIIGIAIMMGTNPSPTPKNPSDPNPAQNTSNNPISPPPVNPNPSNNSNNNANPVITPIDNSINITGNYRIVLKNHNPQYYQGEDVTLDYSIDNLDNSSLSIPKNSASGVEIKSGTGTALQSYPSNENLMVISDDILILPLKNAKGSVSFSTDQYGLTCTDTVDGCYYAINIYIGNVKSNKVMSRILRKV